MSSVRVLAVAAAALRVHCAEEVGSFSVGAVYTGSFHGKTVSTANWPNGAFAADIKHCQQTCQTTKDWCEAFTYSENAGKKWGPGACWLFGPGATLSTSDTHSDFTSGPKYFAGQEPATTTAPVVATLIMTTPGTGEEASTSLAETSGASVGGFKWWGYLLGLLAVVFAGLIGYFLFCDQGDPASKKKKKKRSTRSVKVDQAVAPSSVETRSLMADVPVATISEPVYTFSGPVASQYVNAAAVPVQTGSTYISYSAQPYTQASG